MTVGDAQKKFHDPESIFWVSNNTFLKTINPLDFFHLQIVPYTRTKKKM